MAHEKAQLISALLGNLAWHSGILIVSSAYEVSQFHPRDRILDIIFECWVAHIYGWTVKSLSKIYRTYALVEDRYSRGHF